MVLDCKDADDIEMNEKYVHHEDDFDDNDLIWCCLLQKKIHSFLRFIENTMEFEHMKKVIDDRNSTRLFNGKKIEEGVLEEILGYSLVIEYWRIM